MPSCFRFKAIRAVLTTEEVAAVRRISPHSIAEIRRRAASGESLLDIPVFSGEWPASRDTVIAILKDIESGHAPLAVFSVDPDSAPDQSEEPMSLEQAQQWLQLLKEIADQVAKHSEREAGG